MKRTRGNIPKLYVFASLKMALFPMAIITLFWKDHIGLSLTQILLIQGIFSMVAMALEYPSGYISDRLGYRFSLNLASVFGILGWAFYTTADSFADVLFAEFLLGISWAFISGSDSALLYESLRLESREHDYARCEGRMAGFSQASEATAALFAGLMYTVWPFFPFVLQVGVWILGFLVTRSMTEVSYKNSMASSSHLLEALRTVRYAFLENRRLRYTIFLTSILGISSFFPVWLIQPYMQQAGMPLHWFGPIWAGANLTVALSSLVSYRVQFFLGNRGMVWLFMGLTLAAYLGLGLTESLWGFLFYYLLTTMRGLRVPMMKHQAQQESRSGTRASILSLMAFAFRLVFVCTAPVIGYLADSFGLHSTFRILTIILSVLLLPLTILFIRNQPQMRRSG